MRNFASTILAGVLGLSMIIGASAEEPVSADAHIEVTENPTGGLNVLIGNADFESVPYDLKTQTASTDIVLTVTDDRGSNAGWSVTLSGSEFSDGENSIGIENLSLPNEAKVTGSPGSTDSITTSGGTVVEAPESVSIVTAPEGSGTGQYTVEFIGSELTIPGGTLVGEYKSTLQVSITSGP